MKIILLDRDGTVIVDPEDRRVDRIEKIELFDDTIESLRLLAQNNFSVIFITNQAGIEEGRMTEAQFWTIHARVIEKLEVSGVTILKTYMNGEMEKPDATEWRKPGPKMLHQAAKDFSFDLSEVYMVGDNQSDVQAAVNASCKGGILVETGNSPVVSRDAIYTAPNLLDAVQFLLSDQS